MNDGNNSIISPISFLRPLPSSFPPPLTMMSCASSSFGGCDVFLEGWFRRFGEVSHLFSLLPVEVFPHAAFDGELFWRKSSSSWIPSIVHLGDDGLFSVLVEEKCVFQSPTMHLCVPRRTRWSEDPLGSRGSYDGTPMEGVSISFTYGSANIQLASISKESIEELFLCLLRCILHHPKGWLAQFPGFYLPDVYLKWPLCMTDWGSLKGFKSLRGLFYSVHPMTRRILSPPSEHAYGMPMLPMSGCVFESGHLDTMFGLADRCQTEQQQEHVASECVFVGSAPPSMQLLYHLMGFEGVLRPTSMLHARVSPAIVIKTNAHFKECVFDGVVACDIGTHLLANGGLKTKIEVTFDRCTFRGICGVRIFCDADVKFNECIISATLPFGVHAEESSGSSGSVGKGRHGMKTIKVRDVDMPKTTDSGEMAAYNTFDTRTRYGLSWLHFQHVGLLVRKNAQVRIRDTAIVGYHAAIATFEPDTAVFVSGAKSLLKSKRAIYARMGSTIRVHDDVVVDGSVSKKSW
jgi:hypothetical protein